jgi:salicylate hydroxylase
MCLLGDSAHATTPHLGAGAGMAMEDAYILSNLIASAGSTESIEKAFFAYDAVRRPRTQECIRRSLNTAFAFDFLLPDVKDDMEKIHEVVGKSYDWLWHIDLEAQLQSAKDLLET